ncbi:hypothetical protein FH972_019194 [Carpinus fangiana]|uniref:Uncharacterized protein n=1 Tax=Carpinus fangiana TaxID=176857 RepID=A0A5N6RPP3_9ROSI|nr:hypothetical protein FH972_019194 [Carpinus fangiana]
MVVTRDRPILVSITSPWSPIAPWGSRRRHTWKFITKVIELYKSCSQLPMMSGFPAKSMAAVVVAVFLLVAAIPTTSADGGGRKNLWDGSTKTIPREESSYKGLNTSLKAGGSSPPPAPIKNKAPAMTGTAPPPPPNIQE